MKFCATVRIAGDSTSVQKFYFSCCGMEYLRLIFKQEAVSLILFTYLYMKRNATSKNMLYIAV